jgi:hypothetical protein
MEVKERVPWIQSDFKFEARWLHEEGCDEVISESWKKGWDGGGRNVAQVIHSMVGDLTYWSRDVVGDLEKRIKKTRAELEVCMRSPISQDKVLEETRLRCHLEHLEELKNIKWRQTAHAWWLKDGDQNTRYFHFFAIARKKITK